MDMEMSTKLKCLLNSGHLAPVDIWGHIIALELKNSFTLCQKCDILFLTIESDKYDRIH